MTQLVQPNLNVTDGAGWCLRFTQSVYGLTGAPFWHPSAWAAWRATEYKHTGPLPNASVPVWFSHYGTYGDPPTYGNWGHVVAYVPGKGFLSSPAWLRPGQTRGQLWLSSIEEVERTFNAKYVGWSEDLNGTRIINAAGGSSGSTPGGLTVSEAEDIKKYVKQQMDAMERRLKGSSQLGWVKNILQRIWMRNPSVNVNVDAAELANEIREAFGDDLASDVADELGKRLGKK